MECPGDGVSQLFQNYGFIKKSENYSHLKKKKYDGMKRVEKTGQMDISRKRKVYS